MPIKNAQGKVARILKLAQDCTDEHLRQTDIEGKINAIGRALAVIEFSMDGRITHANENFLKAMGYERDEVIGKHHSMFVSSEQRASEEYKSFWRRLNAGEFIAGDFNRMGNGGKDIWIQASYNPIFDLENKPYKVVKYATDITAQKLRNADFEGQINAIAKSQAVIEFRLDGTIVNANETFLKAMGYGLEEIQGRHHSMFVDPEFSSSAEYRSFWDSLRHGQFHAGRYKRFGRGSKEIWIQASYNPIFDINGRPAKVVKYASDVTEQVKLMNEISNLATAAQQLAEASSMMSNSAAQMNVNSQETATQATEAAAAASEVTKGVNSVAASTEEMRASVREIARSALNALKMTEETKSKAVGTNETMVKLGSSSKEIGNVIKVISAIAQQTNLLALNATIEAARAGDAGRGFAVVANEVKDLAKQTAKATEDITIRISAIQTDSAEAGRAIEDIGQRIDQLNQISGVIAAAVEEQSATTNEVARVVQDSSRAVDGIAGNVRTVSQAAASTSEGSVQVMSAAKGLQELAARLQDMVGRLKQS